MPATYQPTLPNFVETATYYEIDIASPESAAVARSVPEDEIADLGNKALQNVLLRQLRQDRLEHGVISFPFVTTAGHVTHVISVSRGRRWAGATAEEARTTAGHDEPFEIFADVPEPRGRWAAFMSRILHVGRE